MESDYTVVCKLLFYSFLNAAENMLAFQILGASHICICILKCKGARELHFKIKIVYFNFKIYVSAGYKSNIYDQFGLWMRDFEVVSPKTV